MTSRSTAITKTLPKRSRPGRIEGRLRDALLAMIWENATDYDVASKFKISLAAIRSAMKKPFVRKFIREERHVFIAQQRLKNPHRLADVADNSANGNARVAAVRMLEQLDGDEPNTGAAATTPGVVIIIGNANQPPQRVIGAPPQIEGKATASSENPTLIGHALDSDEE